jgi:hypothetical protein
MGFYDELASRATPVSVEPESTSYFSPSSPGLDPRLFRDNMLIGKVRQGILSILFDHLHRHYYNPEAYIHAWLAGSGVSFQWAAQRDPGDLDCLVGVDYTDFRRSNPQYVGFSDQEIASMFNEDFRNELYPLTEHYLDSFELTFYVNVQTDITKIKPYAAYSLTDDDWTVPPQELNAPENAKWKILTNKDLSMGIEIIDRYSKALNDIANATNQASRINAEAALKLAVQQGAALFDVIHEGRKTAFSPSGLGYSDYANFRWQSGKATGLIPALRTLKDVSTKTRQEFDAQTYGVELPDAKVLIRRAMTRN